MTLPCSSCGAEADAHLRKISVCHNCYDSLTAQFVSKWGDESDDAIAALTSDKSFGNYLLLKVGANGNKSWICRCPDATGKRRDFGLGAWPAVSIHEARGKALITSRAARTVPTLTNAAANCYADITGKFTNNKHAAQWLTSVEEICAGALGRKQLHEIDQKAIAEALRPIYARAPETARRTLQRISLIFSWAFHHGRIGYELSTSSVQAMLEGQGTRFSKYLGQGEEPF